MLATCKLENEHGTFRHGHLLSYFANNELKLGILTAIAQNELNKQVIFFLIFSIFYYNNSYLTTRIFDVLFNNV